MFIRSDTTRASFIGESGDDTREQRSDRLQRHDVVDLHVVDCALRHRRVCGIRRVLGDCHAAQLLDGPETRSTVIEVAGQNHAYGGGTIHLGRGSEQRVDGGPEAILARALGEAKSVGLEHHVTVGRSHIDMARLRPLSSTHRVRW